MFIFSLFWRAIIIIIITFFFVDRSEQTVECAFSEVEIETRRGRKIKFADPIARPEVFSITIAPAPSAGPKREPVEN